METHKEERIPTRDQPWIGPLDGPKWPWPDPITEPFDPYAEYWPFPKGMGD